MDLSFAHNEPLAGAPLVVTTLLLRVVKATLHAKHGLLILTHGQLLQVVVCLEHDLTHRCPRQPLRLEALLLHRALRAAAGPRRVDRVQREERLAALAAPHLQGNREILEIDRCPWLECRPDCHGDIARGLVFDQGEATHALRHDAAIELLSCSDIRGHDTRMPADFILRTTGLFELSLFLLALLLLLSHFPQHVLGHALSVHHRLLLATAGVSIHAQREAALLAQEDLLAARFLLFTLLFSSICCDVEGEDLPLHVRSAEAMTAGEDLALPVQWESMPAALEHDLGLLNL
mmetsp:Transcript_24691/g.61784  ORF Transcript_24691/g.61784 Transcript_24691/m.61784 type:complete len:291 (+) Transcript_24691:2013-2885(+)